MKKRLWVMAVLVLAAGLFAIKYYTMWLDSKDSAEVIGRSYEYEKDFSDRETLVNSVDNIFIGEVVEEKGSGNHAGNPATLYGVRITQNIKGALLGGITVIQEGGYYKENGNLYKLQYENDSLLKKGQMYLFAVMAEKPGEYWMMPKYGHKKLDNEDEKHKELGAILAILEHKE